MGSTTVPTTNSQMSIAGTPSLNLQMQEMLSLAWKNPDSKLTSRCSVCRKEWGVPIKFVHASQGDNSNSPDGTYEVLDVYSSSVEMSPYLVPLLSTITRAWNLVEESHSIPFGLLKRTWHLERQTMQPWMGHLFLASLKNTLGCGDVFQGCAQR